MTDINLASSPAPTVLAEVLAAAGPPPSSAAYHGMLTPTELDARPREIAALVSAAAVHDLGWLRRVFVRGNDRSRWLSGMVTNMVKDLAPNAGAWNLVLNAQGRIQGDLTVWNPGQESDELEVEVTADQAEKLLPYLDRFIVMDDVELVPVKNQTAVGVTGPKASEVLARLGLPVLTERMTQARGEWNTAEVLVRREYGALADHHQIWIADARVGDLWRALEAAGAQPVGSAALEALRIAEGIPAYGIDMMERDLPQETSQMRALHFDKGCYIGQEIVERIRSRGNVHRHLRLLELDGPVAEGGTKLSLDGAEAGNITSATELPLAEGTRIFAIGMIRGEAEGRNLPMKYSVGETGGSASILAGPPSLVAGMER